MSSITPLRIIFAGTPELAVPTLAALLASHHQVIAVYTQPDRPAGRGRELTMSPVKALALQHHVPVMQPLSLRDPQAQQEFIDLKADVMIVLGYGLILPKIILDAPRYGCINVHISLLPRWRGAAPAQRAILAGDSKTGVSIMQMDEGLDTGPVFTKAECAITTTETSQTLHEKLAHLGAHTLMPVLDQLQTGQLHATPQHEADTCYATKINKAEAKMDWSLDADYLARAVRAFNPWPMANFQFNGEAVRVWEAAALSEKNTATPGTIIRISKEGLDVATGKGLLRITRLQLPGGRALSFAELLNGKPNLFQAQTQLS